jgi:hypothetical protein
MPQMSVKMHWAYEPNLSLQQSSSFPYDPLDWLVHLPLLKVNERPAHDVGSGVISIGAGDGLGVGSGVTITSSSTSIKSSTPVSKFLNLTPDKLPLAQSISSVPRTKAARTNFISKTIQFVVEFVANL